MAKPTKIESLKSSLDIAGISYNAEATLEELIAIKTKFTEDVQLDTSSMNTVQGLDSLQTIEEPIRIKLICNNPEKRAHKGEYFGAGNSFGTIKAFVPYNCPTANDMLVPLGLVEVIRQREFLHVRELDDQERKNSGGAVLHVTTYTKEFTIVELPMDK